MNELARLIFPSLRWRDSSGFEHEAAKIDRSLELGVGGFIIFQGEPDAVAALSAGLQAASRHPLLIASDLERGAGQQFPGLTHLPTPAALGFLNRTEFTRRCAEITAAEAASVGINWVYAPVADLDSEPENPIVSTRSFGDDPTAVSNHVAAWVSGVEGAGVVASAKHYPGHGRTLADSHDTLPVVPAALAELEASDLAPFAAAVDAGVRSIMTAHVAFPSWDPSGLPATLSPTMLGHLRSELDFDGLIVTDALIMEGALRGEGEADAVVRAVAAGCDALLYPRSVSAVLEGLEAAATTELPAARIDDALGRIDRLADTVPVGVEPLDALAGHEEYAAALADISIHMLRGDQVVVDDPIQIDVVDDDEGGPYRVGDRRIFDATLRDAGVSVGRGSRVVLVYAEPRSWKGRAGLGERSLGRLRRILPGAELVVLFGHPRIGAQIPGDAPLLCCWHGQPLMQQAAARWVVARLG